MHQVFTCSRCGASTDQDLEYGVCAECPPVQTTRDRLIAAVRKAACDVFRGINAKEQTVFANEIASAITNDVYTKALLRAVAAGRDSDGE
jgi:hypothetical protein